MRKLLPWLMILSVPFWAGCGSDDDDDGGTNGNGGDPVLTQVPVNSSVAAPDMDSVNHDSWDSITPVGMAVSNVEAPNFEAKVTAFFTDSVWIQAIKASGRLYLRLQWDDNDYSILRNQWVLDSVEIYRWVSSEVLHNEDQVLVMFDMGDDSTWDAWNWRLLTTGQAKTAEGMTYNETNDSLSLDTHDDEDTLAWRNKNPGDTGWPKWIHEDTSDFTGDVMFIYETLPARDGQDAPYSKGQTVPGWVLVDSVVPADMRAQSRWDIEAVYDYDDIAHRYTLVLARDLSSGADDLDMSSLAEVRTKIGILDDELLTNNSTSKIFTEDFLLDF